MYEHGSGPPKAADQPIKLGGEPPGGITGLPERKPMEDPKEQPTGNENRTEAGKADPIESAQRELAQARTDAEDTATEIGDEINKLAASGTDLGVETGEFTDLQHQLDAVGEQTDQAWGSTFGDWGTDSSGSWDTGGWTEYGPGATTSPTDRREPLSDAEREGSLRVRTLKDIESTDSFFATNDRPRMFTDAQLEEARTDPQKFEELFRSGLDQDPYALLRTLDTAQGIYSEDEFRTALDKAGKAHPSDFIRNFTKVEDFYEPDEKKAVVTSLIDTKQNPDTAISMFSQPEIATLFEQDEARAVILEAADTAPGSLLGSYDVAQQQVRKYIENGYITEDDVRAIGLKALADPEKSYQTGGIFGYAEYFQGEDRDVLEKTTKEAFTRKQEPLHIFKIDDAGDLLTGDEKRDIIRQRFKDDPSSLATSTEVITKYLDRDEITKFLTESIDREDWHLYNSTNASELILKGDYVTDEMKARYREISFDTYPYGVLSNPEPYMEGLTQDEKVDAIRRVATSNPKYFISYTYNVLPIISEDKAEQERFLGEIIRGSNIFETTEAFTKGGSFIEVGGVKRDEVKQLLYDQLNQDTEPPIGNSRTMAEIRTIFGNDQEFKSFIEQASDAYPETTIRGIRSFRYLFTEDETAAFITKTASSSKEAATECVDMIGEWHQAANPEFTHGFLEGQREINTARIMEKLSDLKKYIPEDQQRSFVTELTKTNPALALIDVDALKAYIPDASTESIVAMASADAERFGMMPKALTEFYKKVSSSKDITEKGALLLEGAEIYSYIGMIRTGELGDTYKQIHDAGDLTGKQEQELLSTMACVAIIKDKDPEAFASLDLGTTPEDAGKAVLQSIGEKTGREGAITDEERTRFFDTMGSPAPFMIYMLQYEDSPGHKEILDNMAQGVLSGNYDTWKYGPPTQEALDALIDQKLLPNITLEQYQKWQTDERTTLHETLAADAETVANEIKNLMQENAEHLESEIFDNTDLSYGEMLNGIQEQMVEVGQEYAAINRRLGEMRKSGEDMEGEEAQGLQAQKAELDATKADLAKNKAILRVLTLKPDEVSSGYLLEGDTRKKATKIGKTLEGLRDQLPQEGGFVVDRVRQLITGFHDQNEEKQDLVASDSSDPKITIEVGAKPVGSCQNYSQGAYNECLLGYTDPNVKVMTLANERGNLVARAIFRMLPQEDGQAALHLERIYSASASKGVDRAMFAHASAKAEELNMPLFVSAEAQNEEGVLIAVDPPQGFAVADSDAKLTSSASRAPFSYVDSAGGKVENGTYAMTNLKQVQRAA